MDIGGITKVEKNAQDGPLGSHLHLKCTQEQGDNKEEWTVQVRGEEGNSKVENQGGSGQLCSVLQKMKRG